MQDAITTLNRLAEWWAVAAELVLIQGTLVVAAGFGLTLLFTRPSQPAPRYWLWQLVTAKLLLLPVFTWTYSVPLLPARPAPTPFVESASTVTMVVTQPALPSNHDLVMPVAQAPPKELPAIAPRSLLMLLWAAIVAWRFGIVARRYRQLRVLLKQTEPADRSLVETVRRLARRMRIRGAISVRSSPDGVAMVCGIARPTIVIPEPLLHALTPRQLRAVLRHELAHIARRDLLWCWLPECARTFYFFHPVVHWLCRQIHLERELASDQRACNTGAADYADTLLRVAELMARPGNRTALNGLQR